MLGAAWKTSFSLSGQPSSSSKLSKLQTQQPQQPQQPQRLRPAGFFIAGSSPSGSEVETNSSGESCFLHGQKSEAESEVAQPPLLVCQNHPWEKTAWRLCILWIQLPCLNSTKGRAHGQAFPYSILLTSLKPQNRPQVSSLESHHQHHAQCHDVHLIEKALLHEAAPDDRQPPWADSKPMRWIRTLPNCWQDHDMMMMTILPLDIRP